MQIKDIEVGKEYRVGISYISQGDTLASSSHILAKVLDKGKHIADEERAERLRGAGGSHWKAGKAEPNTNVKLEVTDAKTYAGGNYEPGTILYAPARRVLVEREEGDRLERERSQRLRADQIESERNQRAAQELCEKLHTAQIRCGLVSSVDPERPLLRFVSQAVRWNGKEWRVELAHGSNPIEFVRRATTMIFDSPDVTADNPFTTEEN